MSETTFVYRRMERTGSCRDCDKAIRPGDMVVSGYSQRGSKGMNIIFHPECVKKIFDLIPKDDNSNS